MIKTIGEETTAHFGSWKGKMFNKRLNRDQESESLAEGGKAEKFSALLPASSQKLIPRISGSRARNRWTSRVGQWLRIRLPTQGTWVRPLVWEDPTCCGATKPVCHNY